MKKVNIGDHFTFEKLRLLTVPESQDGCTGCFFNERYECPEVNCAQASRDDNFGVMFVLDQYKYGK